MLQCENLPAVLNELKQIVITPIKLFTPPPHIPTSTMTHLAAPGCESPQQERHELPQTAPPHPDDLPALILRVMGKGNVANLWLNFLFVAFGLDSEVDKFFAPNGLNQEDVSMQTSSVEDLILGHKGLSKRVIVPLLSC